MLALLVDLARAAHRKGDHALIVKHTQKCLDQKVRGI
jgi:hypothetical protein